MLIDIFHDPVCPWCRIGKKHLFDALEQWQVEAVNIRWHAFLLDDTIPPQGYDRSFMNSLLVPFAPHPHKVGAPSSPCPPIFPFFPISLKSPAPYSLLW